MGHDWPIRGPLARQDSNERQHVQCQSLDGDHLGRSVLRGKTLEPGHRIHDIESVAERTTKRRWHHPEPRNPKAAGDLRSFGNSRVARALEPEVDVDGRRIRALKDRRGDADDHISDPLCVELGQEPALNVGQHGVCQEFLASIVARACVEGCTARDIRPMDRDRDDG